MSCTLASFTSAERRGRKGGEVAKWGKYVAGLMEALMIAKCNNIIVLLKLKHEQQFII